MGPRACDKQVTMRKAGICRSLSVTASKTAKGGDCNYCRLSKHELEDTTANFS